MARRTRSMKSSSLMGPRSGKMTRPDTRKAGSLRIILARPRSGRAANLFFAKFKCLMVSSKHVKVASSKALSMKRLALGNDPDSGGGQLLYIAQNKLKDYTGHEGLFSLTPASCGKIPQRVSSDAQRLWSLRSDCEIRRKADRRRIEKSRARPEPLDRGSDHRSSRGAS